MTTPQIPQLMPGAEPFAFDGGQTGVLLIHGYTGTPQGLREWGEYLAGRGYAVMGPRLPGHGTTPSDLHNVTDADWIDEAERALRGLQERCNDVFVAGLSMGGCVALDIASRLGSELAGLILVNPFIYTNDPRAKLAPLISKVPLLLKGVYDDVADPSRHELGYPKVSTKSSYSVIQMGQRVRENLPKITLPTIIFTSRQDHVVHPGNSSLVYETISSKEKEIVWLERSYHVATIDYDREIIFEQSAKFIAQHEEA